jgi:hypothetical protein
MLFCMNSGVSVYISSLIKKEIENLSGVEIDNGVVP